MKNRIFTIVIFTLLCPLFIFSQDIQQRSLSEVLDHTGKIKPGFNGSFSAEGFSMQTGKNGEPVFVDANEEWIPLFSGLNNIVLAIAISGNNVYAGGQFTTAGGNPANYIAKWNGTNWSALGSGLNSNVNSIAISGNDVYAGGDFTTADGNPANYIAKWNGTNWSALGSGLNSVVKSIAISGNDVYAGGYFSTAGGISANRIARWNGTSWSALGSGITGLVFSIAVSGIDVYAGGYFTIAGGNPANYIAKWNGTSWSALGIGLNSRVYYLAISGTDIYIGGEFTTAGGIPANRIAKWNGTNWSALGNGMNSIVNSIAISGTDVYAGGHFTTAGGISANYIAKWNGTNWSALGSGLNGNVNSIAISVNDVYACGYFTTAGGIPANRIAKWTDPLINGNVIRGIAFRDLNGNNIQDPGEPGLSNSVIQITPGPLYFLTNSQGIYSAYVESGNFTVSIPNPILYHISTPQSHNVNFTGVGNTITNKNFALVATQNINDAKISLTGISPTRPGFDFNMRITYENVGTQTLSNSVRLNFPSNITYLSSVPLGNLSGNLITWQYLNLLPGEIRNIDISFNVPAAMPLGAHLICNAEIDPISNDPTPWNNVNILDQVVIGSYDPNDKQVLPDSNITPQQVINQDSLTYLIRFQNTGTADAITVELRDTMSNKLDLGTFEMISSSHSYVCTIESNRQVRWTFSNINLPNSNTNEPGSHGYVKYRIKPKSTLVLGDVIKNTAYIYFDFNEPIITNTTLTLVANPDPPLPVELTSFVSIVTGNDVQLIWTTSSEINNAGFDIERIDAAGEWNKVGHVTGNGNSSTQQDYTFTDKNLVSGNYNYRLKQIDFNGNFEYYNLINEIIIGIPDKYILEQNYPNPFNPNTIINYQLSMFNFVSIKVYDVLGNEVASLVTEKQDAGYYSVEFDGSGFASGIYFYIFEAGSFVETKKMILLK